MGKALCSTIIFHTGILPEDILIVPYLESTTEMSFHCFSLLIVTVYLGEATVFKVCECCCPLGFLCFSLA